MWSALHDAAGRAAIPGLRLVDVGPLENARLVEPMTALLIGIKHRNKTDRSGIRITGI
jgi:predicted dinucleotide-binding enzyme